jgi:hypothetical protein
MARDLIAAVMTQPALDLVHGLDIVIVPEGIESAQQPPTFGAKRCCVARVRCFGQADRRREIAVLVRAMQRTQPS